MEHLLNSIASLAGEQDLPVLLIGGHAVTALGHSRSTFDVDLLIPRSLRQRWRLLILRLHYRVFGETEHFLQFEPHHDFPLPDLDLMLVDDDVFRILFQAREICDPLPTPNVEGMIALKLHAINQPSRRRSEQDWSDILALIDLHRLSLDDPSFSAIVLKHGGETALERIRAHLARGDQF